MKIEEVIASLKESNAKEVGKEIGMCDKRLLKGLNNAGYKHSKKGGIGWYFTGEGEAPLKADIREFVKVADAKKPETTNDAHTKKEVVTLGKLMSELVTIKNAVNEIKQEKEGILAQKNIDPIHSLHDRTRENRSKEKVSRTVNLNKGTCSQLGTFEDVLRINRDDIIEIALREFFEKYKAQ